MIFFPQSLAWNIVDMNRIHEVSSYPRDNGSRRRRNEPRSRGPCTFRADSAGLFFRDILQDFDVSMPTACDKGHCSTEERPANAQWGL